ncbi:MAG: ABC transporter permease [Vulcanimicrobiota bacterium]
MDIFIIIKTAIKSLFQNKMRTLLTMLGVIIGVGAVIAMLAITEGVKRKVMGHLDTFGNSVLYVWARSTRSGGRLIHTYFENDDLDAISRYSPHVKAVSPTVYSNGLALYKEKNVEVSIEGGNVHYPEILNLKLQKGRFYTASEAVSGAKICLIGSTVYEELFDYGENPLDKTIRVKQIPFKIIGVLDQRGAGDDDFANRIILMPYKTATSRINRQRRIRNFQVLLYSNDDYKLAREEITEILNDRLRVKPGAEEAFRIHSPEEFKEMFDEFIKTMGLLLGGVATVSLLVGGIGIMNIMLVTITERIREIGIRMAVGAKSRDIMIQFLVESVTISLIGGLLGVLFGVILSNFIGRISEWDIYISNWSVMLALAFSSIIGVSFGFYPAWKASKLDPIEALRHE